jgi:hypothetical protein
MKIRLMIIAVLLFFSCITYGDERFDLDSPEGWAMAFMTTSAQNLGQMPPQSVNIKDISISAELSSIPRLSKEQQKVGLGGYKNEDLNKSPAFGRLRASMGLPWDVSAEISWTPPVKINDSKPDHLWGAALSKPIFNNEKIGIGLRLFLLRGGVIASVTCSEDAIKYEAYSDENYVGCVGLSNDRLQMNHEGVEVFLSFKNSLAIDPWISLASSSINSSVDIDAPIYNSETPLEEFRQKSTIHSSGLIHTFSAGLNYDLDEDWSLNLSGSYTPLDVQRSNNNSDNDDFWNLRLGLTVRF